MTRFYFFSVVILTPLSALAQDNITIEATDGFRFVRCVDAFGSASCEFIAEPGSPVRCVAFNADGDPIAVVPTFPEMGTATFADINANDVADMICE